MTRRRVSLAEAGALLKVSARRLRVLCAQGRVPSARREETARGPVWTVELRDSRLQVEGRDMGPPLRL